MSIPLKNVQVVQVIITTMERRGSGEDSNSPVRIITQFWDLSGDLIGEIDPSSKTPEEIFQQTQAGLIRKQL